MPKNQQLHSNIYTEVAQSLSNLGWLYNQQGNYAEAEPLLQRALDIQEQTLRSGHPNIAHSLNTLAHLYKMQGRYTEAELHLQGALHIQEQSLGSNETSPVER